MVAEEKPDRGNRERNDRNDRERSDRGREIAVANNAASGSNR